MSAQRTFRIVTLLTYFYMVGMNALATTLPLNGQSTNEISDRYDTLFAPIGFTFSIWGIIYLLLGVYSVFQLVADNDTIRTITPWFIASNVLNGTWIIAWHYDVIWGSLLIIVALLITLIVINKSTTSERVDWGNTVAVRLPFAVYFGWVTVATVANASAFLVSLGFRGGVVLSETAWTITILLVAAAIGIGVTWINSSMAYGLVFVWAFWGILSRHLSPEEWNEAYPAVILTLQIVLPVLAVSALVGGVRWLRHPVSEWKTAALWKTGSGGA